jgi:hypothetical protein
MGVAVVFCSLWGCGSATEETVVTGTVKFRGKLVPFGAVRFFDEGQNLIASTQLGQDGIYRISGLRTGTYIVCVNTRYTAVSPPLFQSPPRGVFGPDGNPLAPQKPENNWKPWRKKDIGSPPGVSPHLFAEFSQLNDICGRPAFSKFKLTVQPGSQDYPIIIE